MGVFVTACSSYEAPSVPDNAGRCKEPRATMCTREYRPVCGVQKNSVAKTYGNACSACGDEKVIYFSSGACAAQKP